MKNLKAECSREREAQVQRLSLGMTEGWSEGGEELERQGAGQNRSYKELGF